MTTRRSYLGKKDKESVRNVAMTSNPNVNQALFPKQSNIFGSFCEYVKYSFFFFFVRGFLPILFIYYVITITKEIIFLQLNLHTKIIYNKKKYLAFFYCWS